MDEEERKKKYEQLRQVRGGHRGLTTKLIKEAKELPLITPLSPEAKSRLHVISKQLSLKSSCLNNLDSEVLNLCEVSDINGEVEEADNVTAKIIECQSKLQLVIKSAVEASATPPTVSNPHTGASVIIPPSTVSQARTQLPKLELPKFKSDLTTWTAFWNSFNSAVHENPGISNVDEFNYLKSRLEGLAARCIEGLSVTADNYDNAIELLQNHFSKTQHVIAIHMDALIKITSNSNDKPSSLRFEFDKINVHARGLATLGIRSEQYNSILIPIVMSKLPSEIRLRIARETKDDVWKLDDLLSIIKNEVEAREASEGVKVSHGKLPTHQLKFHGHTHNTASSLYASNGKVQHVYCNGEHYSASCERVHGLKKRQEL